MCKTLIWLTLLVAGSAFFVPVTAQVAKDSATALIESHRKKKHDEMRSEKSPLQGKERKRFKGLKYYPVDLAYRVPAKFVKTADAQLFKMKTTTARLPEYKKFGEVHFMLHGNSYMLEVYQSQDLMRSEEYKDHLFIPFTDPTNGDETYQVGRYIEMKIPAGENVILDFNLSYNPYCSYSPNYSCPIPPAANHLPIAIKAGEKKYKDH